MAKPKDNKFSEERRAVQDRIADFVSRRGLTNPVSGTGKSGRYRYVLFSKPAILDGQVEIYAPNFIMVGYTTAIRLLPHEDKRVYNNVEDAIAFMDLAFVQGKFDEALAIPTRPKPEDKEDKK